MYSIYKFIVLGACIVYMCVELSSCGIHNQTNENWLDKISADPVFFICNYFHVLLVKVSVRWVTKPELSSLVGQISS